MFFIFIFASVRYWDHQKWDSVFLFKNLHMLLGVKRLRLQFIHVFAIFLCARFSSDVFLLTKTFSHNRLVHWKPAFNIIIKLKCNMKDNLFMWYPKVRLVSKTLGVTSTPAKDITGDRRRKSISNFKSLNCQNLYIPMMDRFCAILF